MWLDLHNECSFAGPCSGLLAASVALLHPHPDLVHFPIRSSPESRPVLLGGHPRAAGRL